MLQKILNLTGVDMLTKTQQVDSFREKVASLDASFMCYCNSVFVGERSSVKECWKTC